MALSRIVSLALITVAQSAPAAPVKTPTTCGEVKQFYRDNTCCGKPAQAVTISAACAYNFTKPLCNNANAQAPRDLSTNAAGQKTPKAATLNVAQQKMLPLANVHYHLGAEHKSDAYKLDADGVAYDKANAAHRRLQEEEHEEDDLDIRMTAAGARRLSANPRPGFMCDATGLTTAEKKAYTFMYCKNVEVGKTYEIHYVHSSAATHLPADAATGKDSMNDGLGGAANGRNQLNPMVVVQGLVVQITNDDSAPVVNDMLHNWDGFTGRTTTNSVMYSGSTTGPSHTNEVCSPYVITWHVDKRCNKISAKSFDNFCKVMKEQHKLDADLAPHGSRKIVDPKWVVKAEFVDGLA